VLAAEALAAGYFHMPQVQNITLALKPGTLNILIGPNGSGKTTLLKALARLLPPLQGKVTLDNKPLTAYPSRLLARRLAILPQIRQTPGLPVYTLVAQGRYPHHGYIQRLNNHDRQIIAAALESCRLTALAERSLNTLSGGERQRAYLAMLLAQETELLLLDEPTTFLDVAHQLEILTLLQKLAQQGKTVLVVLHEIPLALRYADTLFLLQAGRLLGEFTPSDLIASGLISQVFGVNLHQVVTQGVLLTGFTIASEGKFAPPLPGVPNC